MILRRRDFITLLGGAAALPAISPRMARSQQPTTPVIGFLSLQRARSAENEREVAAFTQGLREMGFAVGQNVKIEYRYAEGQRQKLPAFAADLVQRRVNLIVAGANAAPTAKAATTTIPIVFFNGGDPVRLGLVASLSRPGGNLTGFTRLGADIASKRLALLYDLVPHASVIGALFDVDAGKDNVQVDEVSSAARSIGLFVKQIELSAVRGSEAEWDDAFASLARERVGGLFVAASARFAFNMPERPVELAAHYRIPAVYDGPEYSELGGLVSYGASISDIFYQIGLYAGQRREAGGPAGSAADKI